MSEIKLKVSSSPHIRSKITSGNIMLMVDHRAVAVSCLWGMELRTVSSYHAGQHGSGRSPDRVHL